MIPIKSTHKERTCRKWPRIVTLLFVVLNVGLCFQKHIELSDIIKAFFYYSKLMHTIIKS